ncbi:hypothetical protein [Novosphingobium sp. BL-52-GroH]|uniref:hypothetical protein n=1 Tax=Novosphingobium sp. BL-52-GroH TaxID=3349877 RepID=UPI003850B708
MAPARHSTKPERQELGAAGVWHHPRPVWGLGAIFFYVGAEISVGSFLINYLTSPSVVVISHADAAIYVTLFWGRAMTGRFIGAGVMREIAPARVLAVVAIGAGALLATTILTTGWVALWSVVLVGLMNSIMFPTIFTLAIEGLGKLTARGSALLIMAIAGGALLPVLQGVVADRFGIRIAFVLPLLSYVCVLHFARLCGRFPVGAARAVAA